jgi:sugar lactone lactonase YvrE
VRVVDAQGVITTIAGTGLTGYAGDARDALTTDLFFPRGIALPPHGDEVYVCDAGHRRVVALRRIRGRR